MNTIPNIPPQTHEDPNSYFVTDINESKQTLTERMGPFFQTTRYYLIKIWPWVNRALNAIFYFFFGLIRSMIKMAIDQIKNFKGS